MEYKLQSHPNILLKDHLLQVTKSGISRFTDNGIFGSYHELLKVILVFHDLGKGSFFFQDHLNGAPGSNLSKHSEFSAIWVYHYCIELCHLSHLEAILGFVCVRAHHRNLGNVPELLCPELSDDSLRSISAHTEYEELNSIIQSLGLNPVLSHDKFSQIMDQISSTPLSAVFRRQRSLILGHHWLLLNYLFSLLVWADKYSAIFAHEEESHVGTVWNTGILDNYRKRFPDTENPINKIRNSAYDSLALNLQKSINAYTINMPTGSGKTINSLKVSLEIKKADPSYKRIIYALPFTSIIDQNHKVFEEMLDTYGISPYSSILLPHHHLSDFNYRGEDEYSQNEAEYLVETWDSELTITTFVQLLSSVLSTRNNSLKRLQCLARSVIILDEVQNIPHKYWPLLNSVISQLTTLFQAKVILVTATLPMIIGSDNVVELASNKLEWFQSLNRIVLDKSRLLTPISLDDLVDQLLVDHNSHPQQKRLVILNTVQASLDVYNSLGQEIPESELIYLSSNIIPSERMKRISDIRGSKDRRVTIVSTQVVEAGVDIDVDVVYRDLAPLDSIVQAAGRCNRNNSKSCSRIVLYQLINSNKKRYWSYVYDETLVRATLKVLEKEPDDIAEYLVHEICNKYYLFLRDQTTGDYSRRIASSLNRLDLGTALDYHPKTNPEAFHLIDEHPTQTVFIEYDDIASSILERYQDCAWQDAADPFEAKSKKRSILQKMGAFMINVDRKHLKTDDAIYIVHKEDVSMFYDTRTGFKRKQNQEDYIF